MKQELEGKMDKDKELEMLRGFVKWILKKSWEDCPSADIDACDLQNEAEELGIIRCQKVDRNDDRYYYACEELDTDELYVPYWDWSD